MFRMQNKKSEDIRVFATIKLPLRVMNIVSLGLKKAECQKIDAFELWCWRRLLKVPWTARRSDQSWVVIGRTDVEAETPLLWPPDAKS